MGYLFACISIFSFAFSNCLWAFPLKQLSIWQVMAWRSLITSILFFILLLISYYVNLFNCSSIIYIKSISLIDYILCFLFCCYSYLGLVFYNLSLKHKTEVSISIPVTYISSFWGLLMVYLVYDEFVNTSKFFVIVLFFIALYLIDKNANYKKLKLSKGIIFALLAGFIWGTSFALFPIFISQIGVGGFSLILETTVFCCSIIVVFITKQHYEFIHISKQNFFQILPIGLFGFLGVLFYNISTQFIQMSTLIILDSITPIITVIIGALLLKEKLHLKQYLAIIIIIIAVLIIKL